VDARADLRECASLGRVVASSAEAPNCELCVWPELGPTGGALPRRFFLVARHAIAPLVELVWEGRGALARRAGAAPSAAADGGGGGFGGGGRRQLVAAAPPAAPVAADPRVAGADVEVLQSEAGLAGAYYGATVVEGSSGGAVRVAYKALHESPFSDAALEEVVTSIGAEHLRPPPPPTPPAFHAALAAGDAAELKHEEGWWPVALRRCVAPAFEVTSDAFPGLCRAVAAAQLRPAWRWEGYGGGWAYELQAAGRLRFDGAGRPLAELAPAAPAAPASPKANSASMAASEVEAEAAAAEVEAEAAPAPADEAAADEAAEQLA